MKLSNKTILLLALVCIFSISISSVASESPLNALRYAIARLISTLNSPSVQQIEFRNIYIDLDARLIIYKMETRKLTPTIDDLIRKIEAVENIWNQWTSRNTPCSGNDHGWAKRCNAYFELQYKTLGIPLLKQIKTIYDVNPSRHIPDALDALAKAAQAALASTQ